MLVTANQGPSNSAFWMRSHIPSACSLTTQNTSLAAVYYDGADTTKAPTSTPFNIPDITNLADCGNDNLTETVPFYSLTPPTTPATTREMDVGALVNSTGTFLWTLDVRPRPPSRTHPLTNPTEHVLPRRLQRADPLTRQVRQSDLRPALERQELRLE